MQIWDRTFEVQPADSINIWYLEHYVPTRGRRVGLHSLLKVPSNTQHSVIQYSILSENMPMVSTIHPPIILKTRMDSGSTDQLIGERKHESNTPTFF